MNESPPLTLYFHGNDGRRERARLTNCTVAEALEAVQRLFSISGTLYSKVELYRGNQLIETVENTSPGRLGSILVQ